MENVFIAKLKLINPLATYLGKILVFETSDKHFIFAPVAEVELRFFRFVRFLS